MTEADAKKISKLIGILSGAERVAALTGAGISVPSGIPDFRSADGLYSAPHGKYTAEEVLSHTFFMRHPEDFFDFYKTKMLYPDAKCNDAHLWLAEIERQDRLTAVVTQNIDGLHSAAGSGRVLELHGSVHRNYCMSCGRRYPLSFVTNSTGIPRCGCGGIVRPDVVLYEESLSSSVLEKSVGAIANADVLLVIGTSLKVYPAAGLINYFSGRSLVLVNKSATACDSRADLVISCDAAEVARECMKAR